MNPKEVLIWWVASVAVIGAGILCAVLSGRRQTYLASLATAAGCGLGMLYALRLMMLTSA